MVSRHILSMSDCETGDRLGSQETGGGPRRDNESGGRRGRLAARHQSRSVRSSVVVGLCRSFERGFRVRMGLGRVLMASCMLAHRVVLGSGAVTGGRRLVALGGIGVIVCGHLDYPLG